jgi:exopolysaccharide biosynthesis polyprenyl glycosylphosphotransferase
MAVPPTDLRRLGPDPDGSRAGPKVVASVNAAGPKVVASVNAGRNQREFPLRRPWEGRAWGRLRFGVDLLVLYVAACAAVLADPALRDDWSVRILTVLFPLLVLALMRVRHGGDERLKGSPLESVAQVVGSVSFAAMLTVAAESSLGMRHPLALSLRLWLFGVVYLGIERCVLTSLRRRALRTEAYSVPTLIVGAGVIGSHLVMRLITGPEYGLRPIGFLDADPMRVETRLNMPTVPVLGGPDDLRAAIELTGARHVILAFSSEPDHVLVSKVRECQALGVEISLVPRLYEAMNERTSLDHVGGLPLLTLRAVNPRGWEFTIKHALDRTAALLALMLLSPLIAAIAVAVGFSSPGPVLFRQRRVGRDGHGFTMLKFRTMRGSPSTQGEADASWAAAILNGAASETAESAPLSSVDRTTNVGRLLRSTSLDELPQLFNVFRGDMSLVGPRPERVAYVRDFERFVDRYTDRHRVKSGLTGWAQVNGLRGKTSIADRIEWDNYYIQNWSFALDFKILALTIAEVLRFRHDT